MEDPAFFANVIKCINMVLIFLKKGKEKKFKLIVNMYSTHKTGLSAIYTILSYPLSVYEASPLCLSILY